MICARNFILRSMVDEDLLFIVVLLHIFLEKSFDHTTKSLRHTQSQSTMTQHFEDITIENDLTSKVILRSIRIDKLNSFDSHSAQESAAEHKWIDNVSWKTKSSRHENVPSSSPEISRIRFNVRASQQNFQTSPEEVEFAHDDLLNKHNFVDEQFPRNKTSIFVSNKPFDFKDLIMIQFSGFHKIFKWLRPHEIKV